MIGLAKDLGADPEEEIDYNAETLNYMPEDGPPGLSVSSGSANSEVLTCYGETIGTSEDTNPSGIQELLDKVRTGPPSPLEELEASAPRELIAIVEKAMARCGRPLPRRWRGRARSEAF